MARCASCEAEVVWVISEATGSKMPVDAAPAPDGNLALTRKVDVGRVFARVIGKDEAFAGQRYKSHFVTCPHAGQWRGRKPEVARG